MAATALAGTLCTALTGIHRLTGAIQALIVSAAMLDGALSVNMVPLVPAVMWAGLLTATAILCTALARGRRRDNNPSEHLAVVVHRSISALALAALLMCASAGPATSVAPGVSTMEHVHLGGGSLAPLVIVVIIGHLAATTLAFSTALGSHARAVGQLGQRHRAAVAVEMALMAICVVGMGWMIRW